MIEGLYIHIPFCATKCKYCDFTSFSRCSEEIQTKYVEALEKEAVFRKKNLDIFLKSIFIGGGTPTCLSGGLLERLLLCVKQNFKLQDQIEISVEANPGTINKEKLQVLRGNGVNRISLGVQAFDQKLLTNLGRIHTPQEAREGFYLAREVGFANINLDLMYGLPGQTLAQWENSLQNVLDLNPEHISLYQLKIEEGTPLARQLIRGEIQELSDEVALQMYQLAKKNLTKAGYEHYEISNYARPGYRCIHNQMYWLTKPYLGLGVGAHSYLSAQRIANTDDLTDYIESWQNGIKPPFVEEFLSLPITMSEFMFMGLRLLDGIDLEEFKLRFSQDPQVVFKDAIDKCLNLGLVEFAGQKLKLTAQGVTLGNLVFQEFLL